MSQKIEFNLSKSINPAHINLEYKNKKLIISDLPNEAVLKCVAKDPQSMFYALFLLPFSPLIINEERANNLYVGLEGRLNKADVLRVTGYRDGGSELIEYALNHKRGKLYVPINPKEHPTNTYDGKKVTLHRIFSQHVILGNNIYNRYIR